jgi:hypothetical protein
MKLRDLQHNKLNKWNAEETMMANERKDLYFNECRKGKKNSVKAFKK